MTVMKWYKLFIVEKKNSSLCCLNKNYCQSIGRKAHDRVHLGVMNEKLKTSEQIIPKKDSTSKDTFKSDLQIFIS